MDDRVGYEVFREFFKEFGINPYEFYELSEGRTRGWFPDIRHREPKIDVEELSRVIWGKEKKRWQMAFRPLNRLRAKFRAR